MVGKPSRLAPGRRSLGEGKAGRLTYVRFPSILKAGRISGVTGSLRRQLVDGVRELSPGFQLIPSFCAAEKGSLEV
jgi:hypothetical protein